MLYVPTEAHKEPPPMTSNPEQPNNIPTAGDNPNNAGHLGDIPYDNEPLDRRYKKDYELDTGQLDEIAQTGSLPPLPEGREPAKELPLERPTTQPETTKSKKGLLITLGVGAVGVATAFGAWFGATGGGKVNLPPTTQPTAEAPANPGVVPPVTVETSVPTPAETNITTKEFQSPELEARYNSIIDAVRVPVQEYPDAESAYGQFSTHLENWVSMKSTQAEDEEFFDYVSETQIGNNGSAGVIKDVDREAYINTMFVDGNGGAFAKEINQMNDMLLGNYGHTYYEETPYHLTYTLIDEPSISAPASDNQLSPVIATYHYKDNADMNTIGELNIADGFEPTIDEKHGVYMEMIVVGEGEDAEWKIQKAQIVNRK